MPVLLQIRSGCSWACRESLLISLCVLWAVRGLIIDRYVVANVDGVPNVLITFLNWILPDRAVDRLFTAGAKAPTPKA